MSIQIVKLIARFVHADSGRPVTGPDVRVRFFDRDVLRDDLLGEAVLNSEGVAEVLCSAGSYQSGVLGRVFERLRERKPDIYCELLDAEGRPIFRTPVRWDLDVARVNPVTQVASPTVDLGTYQFRRGEGLDSADTFAGLRPPS
jgi:hypothetical protein